ncbi:MAG: hypothetical protein M1813_002721, partial [Trichoglossum hirsutum]
MNGSSPPCRTRSRRHKVISTFQKCFRIKRLRRTTYIPPQKSNFVTPAPSSNDLVPLLDGTPLNELPPYVVLGELADTQVQARRELPTESLPSSAWDVQAYPTETYYSPMDLDRIRESPSPVSSVSTLSSTEISFRDPSEIHSFYQHGGSVAAATYGDSIATAADGNAGTMTTDHYTPPARGVYQNSHSDPNDIPSTQIGFTSLRASHNLWERHTSSPVDSSLPVIQPADVVQQIRADIVQELVDNSSDGLHVMLDAIHEPLNIWLRDYIMAYTSPSLLLQRCLHALQRATSGSPTTGDDSFFLLYLACTTVPIMRGYCIVQRQRDLSIDADANTNKETAMESCRDYFELINHIDAIRRRLEYRSDALALSGHGLSVPYIMEMIILPLLREPGTDGFGPLAAGIVDALEADRQHDLYDVVARLIRVGYTHGARPLYAGYVKAVILISHAALMAIAGPQSSPGRYAGIITDLTNALEEPTAQATTQYQGSSMYTPAIPPPHRGYFGSPKQNPLSGMGSPDSGYYSISSTPPNTPTEQQFHNIEPLSKLGQLSLGSPTIPHPTAAHQPPPLRLHRRPINQPSSSSQPPPASPPLPLKCRYCKYVPIANTNQHFRQSNLRRHERHQHTERNN